MNASTASLDVYETAKCTKVSFLFHDEAIRHLAKLSRIFVSFLKFSVFSILKYH
jgi:hypothetical protein